MIDSLAVVQNEARDARSCAAAAEQRCLQQEERLVAITNDLHQAEESLAALAERFPWHLDTLRAIRSRLETVQARHAEQQRVVRAAVEQRNRWRDRVTVCQRRLDAERQRAELEAVHASLPGARETAVEQLREVVSTLRQTVRRLEQRNAELRERLGSVESNQLYLVRRLREQEDDLAELRDAQQRFERLDALPAGPAPDGPDRFEPADPLEPATWGDATPTAVPEIKLKDFGRPKASAMCTGADQQEDELVFDEQFDRDVSALIRLMSKYQVERLPMN